MPLMPAPPERGLKVTTNSTLIRQTMERLRAAHAEVCLADFIDEDRPAPEHERRRTPRAQLQLPAILIPVDWSSDEDDAVVPCGAEQIGVTRDVSPTGMGVTHDQILDSDVVIVQLDLPGEAPACFVLELRWSSRRTRYCYMSGGRIAGMVESPLDECSR